MRRSHVISVLIVVISMLLSSCSQGYLNAMIDYSDAQVAVSKEVLRVLNSKSACPLYKNKEFLDGIEERFSIDVPQKTKVKLCKTFEDIDTSLLYVASVAALPSVLTPGVVDEATVAVIFVGGRAVAWVFVYTGALAAVSSIFIGDIVAELVLPAVSSPLETLTQVPSQAIDHLIRGTHHASTKHATADCIAHLARNSQPTQVYYSKDNKSTAFVFKGKPAINRLGNNLGPCTDILQALKLEFTGESVELRNIAFIMAVGHDPIKGYFTYSAYSVKADMLRIQMCDWKYYRRIYPTIAENPFKCLGYVK